MSMSTPPRGYDSPKGQGRAQTGVAIVRGRVMMLTWYVGKGGQRPQTHIMFCIRGHKHAHVVHSSNVEAMRHVWDMRTASTSCQRPTSHGKQPRHLANAKVASHGKLPRPRHAAKAKVAPIGMLLKLGHATKANTASMGKQPKPRHATKAKTTSHCNDLRPFKRSVLALPTEPIHINIMENDSYTY